MPGVKQSADSQAASRVQDEPAAKRTKVAQSKSAGEVPRLVAQREQVRSAFGPVAQLEGGLEEELPAQGKGIAQLAGVEEELPVQGKTIQREGEPSVLADAAEELTFAASEKAEKKNSERSARGTTQRKVVAQLASGEDELPMQGKGIAQLAGIEEEEPMQGKGIAQLAGIEEEEPMQGKGIAQLAGIEEEEPMQGKGIAQLAGIEEEEPMQGKGIAQLAGMEEEEPMQGKAIAQLAGMEEEEPLQAKKNETGMPDNLKSGVESLSGMSMDDVKVHYNSAQPQQLNALAYAQGTDIHVGSGQEKHLPHEAWHVVQQAQGRVKPTMQMKPGVSVNDDVSLEKEADVMGQKALQTKPESGTA